VGNLDTMLTQQASEVASALGNGQTPVSLTASGDVAVVQVVAADGHVVASSANIAGEPPLFDFRPTTGAPTVRDTTVVAFDTADSYRVAALSSGQEAVYVARSTAEIASSVNQLLLELAVGVPILVLAFAALGWLLVGRALRPVETMRQQAERIPGGKPQQRLALPVTRDELTRLATTFNALLDRVDGAARRQREFVADAAHELRSPVASLRAQLDIEADHPELPIAPADRLELAGDAERLARLVDDLLTLARLEAAPGLLRDPVDLDDLVLAEIRRVRARTTCEIDAGGVSGGRVLGDADALDRVVRNVLDNATRHARGRVTVSVRAVSGTVMLTVADDGEGIAPVDRQRVFQRFARLDAGRARAGAGLGLAIVREVVAAHQGAVRIEDNHPGARIVITLPG
jgi:signal transduction histidine kinase